MDQNAFRSCPDVLQFTQWLAERHQSFSVTLAIKSTRFVPGGISADVTGLNAILRYYRWRTAGTDTGDWRETQQRLQTLRHAVQNAIESANDDQVFEACREIFVWGGDRNPRVGALPYLAQLRTDEKLTTYLEQARCAFALDSAILDDRQPPAGKMNSMLTKVHALASSDGLPIYDSRVAAAIAALVELWRREAGFVDQPLPPALTFPATTPDRSVAHLFADAQDPGLLSYAPKNAADTAARWSTAKIRLGWLMRQVLEQADGLFVREEEGSRMHAFEASLFMIGYDVRCLRTNHPATVVTTRQRTTLQRVGQDRLRLEHASLPHKTIRTLRGDQDNLTYAGNVETGISGVWGKTAFAFHSDFLQDLLAEHPADGEVGLGAGKTGQVRPDTIGFWIDAHYPSKPRPYASALAAILVEEGLAESIAGAWPTRIRFV